LGTKELLAALDVPATKIKKTSEEMAQKWCQELKLPLKIRVEVCDWIYQVLGVSSEQRKRRANEPERSCAEKRAKVDCPQADQPEPKVDLQGNQKAAKHDDAEVPVHLWNDRARNDSPFLNLSDEELDCVRHCALAYWK
jgi:hypothetical protein